MHTITLSTEELQVVLAALAAVSPTGGGSTQFFLMNRLVRETRQDVSMERLGRLQTIAHLEYEDAQKF